MRIIHEHFSKAERPGRPNKALAVKAILYFQSKVALAIIMVLLTAACEHRKDMANLGKELEVIVSAETTTPGGAKEKRSRDDDNDTVYVSLRDATDKVFGLRALIEAKLAESGKKITANPSAASYIIQVHILAAQKSGLEESREAMRAKYGGPLPPAGKGAAIIIADIIFAPRVVPSSSSNKRLLANTSSRSVKERCMLRIGIVASGAGRLDAAIGPMSEKLAEALEDTFSNIY